MSTVSLATVLSGLGLGITVTKQVATATSARTAGEAIGGCLCVSLAAGAFVSFVGIMAASFFSANLIGRPDLTGDIRFAAVASGLLAISSTQLAVLQGFEAYRMLAFANVAKLAVFVPLIYVGISLHGVRGASLAYSLSLLAGVLVQHRIVCSVCDSHSTTICYEVDGPRLKSLLAQSLPVLFSALCFTPASWFSTVALMRASGPAQLGIFNVTLSWFSGIQFLAGAISTQALPWFSSMASGRQIRPLCRAVLLLTSMTTISSAVVSTAVVLLAKHILGMYGSSFQSAATALYSMCWAASIGGMMLPLGYLIWALGANTTGVIMALLRALTLVICSWWLAPLGAVGLAHAYLITAVGQLAVTLPWMAILLHVTAKTWFDQKVNPEQLDV